MDSGMGNVTYDLRVVHETLGHDFRSAEFAAADEHIDMGAVLGQICQDVIAGFQRNDTTIGKLTSRLFCCRITTTDDGQRLVPEDGDSAVADCTCTDAALPICSFAFETEPLRTRSCSNDDCVSGLWFLVFLTLSPVPERACSKIDFGHGLGDDRRPEA